ncbi:hypothetical protein XH99_06650 [Bradyrhizobium nanningense]|uniref:Uncharacterized protein n=1 Tax=Bradyrhizobium nanningense TaxID=1325118 RepID=A0A4Q0SEY9_9BRAD|nr:hypothetical protein XH99_06650 [Bradyrhizobium nanningense]
MAPSAARGLSLSMATPSSRYSGACNIISDGSIEPDARTKYSHRAVWLARHQNAYGPDAGSNL